MGSEFVKRKSSSSANKSNTKAFVSPSRSFSPLTSEDNIVNKTELSSEIPQPDYISTKLNFHTPKSAIQRQTETSEDGEKEQQEQERPDVMSKSDAPPAGDQESKEDELTLQPKLLFSSFNLPVVQREEDNSEQKEPEQKSDLISKSDAPTAGDEEHKEENVNVQTAVETASPQSEEEDNQENLNKKSIQTKLTVGKPGDKYEQEADTTAAKVMGMSDETVQRQADEEEKTLQSKKEQNFTPSLSPMTDKGKEEENQAQEIQAKKIQTKGKGNKTQVSSSLESRLGSSKGGGSPLPDNIRSFMEPRFGADFSGVNVHTNSNAVQMNKELGAQAFAHGNDIYYGAGKSPGNDELTAHELTHTIQQTGGKLQAKSINKIGKKENKVQAKPVSIIHMKEASPNKAAPTASPVPTAQTPGGGNKQSKAPALSSGEKAAPTSQTKAGNSPVATTDDGGGKAPKVGNGGEQTRANSPAIVKGDSAAKDSGPNQSKASNAKSESKSAASPETDPDFQAVVSKAKGVAEKKKQHDPADKKAKQAQDAAQSPANEVESKAQGNQVGEMEKAPTPAFNGAAFKAKLMERIKEAAPKNLDEADKFKDNNKLGSVKSEMQDKVKQEQTASQTPLEEKAKQAPDTSGIESKSVTPLPPNPAGTATKNIGARKAVPKAKGQGEVEAPLRESNRKLDQQMADANVTEQQLAKSNEPQFQAALETKKQTQSNANQAPQEYRQFEQNQLNQAQTEASLTAQEQLQGMHGDRAQLLSQVTGQQVGAKGKDEQERAKIAGDIQKIYQQSKAKVETVLSSLDTKVQQAFDDGAAQAKQAFEDYVDQQMEAYKDERYSGLDGKGRWIRDLFLDLPSEVNTFYEKGRQLYLTKMDLVLDRIVNVIGTELTKAKAEIANGRKRIQQYVTKLPQNLKAIGQQAATDIQTQFDQLEQSVDSKQDQLINNLAQKYNENLQTIDSRIDEMKAANQGLVSKASNAIAGVIDTINKLKDMLLSVLNKAAGVIGNILQDPIGFLGNLISGIKQGFENFAGNITNHLQSGLIGWLTGALGPMGIQLPDDIFSLPGIFSLTTQVLGLTFDYIRAKAVKKFGEPVVAGMEQAVEIFQILRDRGAMGLWEHVQEQFNDLKETVIEEIKNMVITQVITAGVKWVLSLLNPASAFVKAAMAIYDIIMFFVNRGSQVLELVNSVVDAVAAIASGAVGGAAKLVENALSRALPVVIGFLASLLGIGGLAKKVEKIIGRIRQRIDKAIDKVLLKAKGLFKGKKGKGNKEEDKLKNKVIPKSLVEPSPVSIQSPTPEIVEKMAQTESGTVLYEKGGDPKQVTQNLLNQHRDAKLDHKSGTLTLPPLKQQSFSNTKSLRHAAAEIARQTGVSKITLVKDSSVIRLDGSINPTVYGLLTYTGVPASLDPLIKEIEGHANTQYPEKENLISICNEAARRHNAKFEFKEIKRPPKRFEAKFEHSTTGEKFITEIVSIYKDNICPACAVPSGIIGSGGSFSGSPGTRKPHNVVSAKVFRDTIDMVLKNYGITTMDVWAKTIIAAGTSSDGPGVTEDKQCDTCEDAQAAWTLMQRANGTAPNGTPLGNQFQHATPAQLKEFTKDKIQSVVDHIRWLLNLKVGTQNRPATSQVNTQIIAARKINQFLKDLITALENAAQ